MRDDSSDFTEDAYRALLKSLLRRWRPIRYVDHAQEGRVCLWRHDVDLSPPRALRLAEIEVEEGVRATYFIHLCSLHYNALDEVTTTTFRRIADLGHDLGLHLDVPCRPGISGAEALRLLESQAALLAAMHERPLVAFSIHDPDKTGWVTEEDVVGGLVNASGRSIRARYSYCSDSNGYWRHRRIMDVVEAGAEERLHVLTHPEWWRESPMPPRQRVERCIAERAELVRARYDSALREAGRLNIG